MKILVLIVAFGLLLTAHIGCIAQTATNSNPGTIHIEAPIHSQGYSGLIKVSAANGLPLGIVLDVSSESGTCAHAFDLPAGNISLSGLIKTINQSFPHHHAMLRNGVLEITPWPLPPHVGDFLKLKINDFKSDAGTHRDHSDTLWMSIRDLIAPREGTSYGGLYSLQSETVKSLELRGQSVEAILNTIASLGKGGIWIIRAADLKTLDPSTPKPFMVYDYVGDQPTAQGVLACRQ